MRCLLSIQAMSSDSVSSSTSGSGRDNELVSKCSSSIFGEGGIQMEVNPGVREDPAEEVAENNMPAKVGYEWVAPDVRTQYSLFRWS